MQRITFKNKNGDIIILKDTFPYLLQNLQGIGAADVTPLVQRGFQQDGMTHFGNLLDIRSINFTAIISDDTRQGLLEKRSEIYRVFNPKLGQGTLEYYNGNSEDIVYSIKCSVIEGPTEVVNQSVRTANMQAFSIGLLCPDPAWEIVPDYPLEMIGFEGGFMLGEEFGNFELGTENGLIFGMQGDYAEIDYNGTLDSSVIVEFQGPASYPTITKIETDEYIKVMIDLLEGEKLYIDTRQDAINVYKIDEDGKKINAFNYIDPYSSYFVLTPGINSLTFSVAAGEPTVKIHYADRFVGV